MTLPPTTDEETPLNQHPQSPESENLYPYGTDLETRRWWILLCFVIYSAGSCFILLSLNSNGGPSMRFFGIDESQLLFILDINLAAVPIFSYIGAWFANKSFKKTLLTCYSLVLIGGWIRFMSGSSYYLVMLGHTFVAIGAAPVFGIAVLVPNRWFSTKERLIVNTISVYANNFGWLLATLMPSFIVKGDPNNMPTYILLQAALISIPFVLGVICLAENPRVPPSYSALVRLTGPTGFLEEIKVLFRKPAFVPFILAFGVPLGINISVAIVSGIVMRDLSFPQIDQSILTSCYVGTGLLTGVIGTIYLARKTVPNYDIIIKVLCTVSQVALTLLGILLHILEVRTLGVILFCMCAAGVGLIGIAPFVYDSILETTFPVPGPVSANTLYIMRCLSTLIINHLSLYPIFETKGFIILAACMLPCWIYGVFFFKTDYRMQKEETENPDIASNTIRSIQKKD